MSDVKKFLDYEGVQHLWSRINMNDYPNNEILMAVINAIDETKLDKNKIFIGTKEEYDDAFRANKISVGAIIVLTDMEC